MKKLAIEPLGDSALVTTGSPLLTALLAKDLRVLMSCGGKGICSTCHVRVSSGMDQLSPMGVKERRTLSLVADTTPESRLACQATVYGDGVTVNVPEGMYIERAEDLLTLLGTRAPENILHPVSGAVLIPKGKIITRSLLEQSRSLEKEVRELRAQTPSQPTFDSRQSPAFTASGVSSRPNQSGTTKVVPRSVAETKANTGPIPAITPFTPPSVMEPPSPQSHTSAPSSGMQPTSRTNITPTYIPPERTHTAGLLVATSLAIPGVLPAPPVEHVAVHPGVQVDKYLLLEQVGKGGAGVVYRALHTKLKTLVAIKFLHVELGSSDGSALERFAKEAQLLAQLSHPNVVRVLDFEDHPKRPYLVMEFVEGLTGSDLIEQSGRVSPVRAIEIVLDVVSGLEAAWKIGIVHRDVKPGNVLVTRNAGSKLVDLGLATFSRADLVGVRPEQAVGAGEGTIGYMSPEAIRRHSVDHRSDIYSLGATLFHLISGRLPFIGNSPYELIFKHLEENPPVLHDLLSSIPPMLSSTIIKMMAKQPAHRYQDYSSLRNNLSDLLQKCK